MLTGFLAAVTLTSYLFLYTPLKRITPAATLIGGIPGALPPVMGWTSVSNEVTMEAMALFAILFCWQMPHFLSLAWMYRKDYARAGYKVLTAIDDGGVQTSRQILLYCAALIPSSLTLALLGKTGSLYGIAAVVLGIVFLVYGLHLYYARTNNAARKVFFASLVYLPVLLLFMALDKM
jgi:protoheme IX farnesyltransferase